MGVIKYELYEDDEGGLYLYLLDDDGYPESEYVGFELAPELGIMLDVLEDLKNGVAPDIIYGAWCDIDVAYRKSCKDHELIGHNGWIQRRALMNAAGRRAFGYPE